MGLRLIQIGQCSETLVQRKLQAWLTVYHTIRFFLLVQLGPPEGAVSEVKGR